VRRTGQRNEQNADGFPGGGKNPGVGWENEAGKAAFRTSAPKFVIKHDAAASALRFFAHSRTFPGFLSSVRFPPFSGYQSFSFYQITVILSTHSTFVTVGIIFEFLVHRPVVL
jgi:hypothetical protein